VVGKTDFAAGRLTPQQAAVAELLVQGLRNAEIGRKLEMKERTVKKHMHGLFQRFGIAGGRKRVKLAILLTLASLISLGCARHRPFSPSNFQAVHSIQFRNCEIVDRRDGTNTCECGKIEWIRDVQQGRWIAVCLK
jgi:DNA-binding CsgD family transcriptional regulator